MSKTDTTADEEQTDNSNTFADKPLSDGRMSERVNDYFFETEARYIAVCKACGKIIGRERDCETIRRTRSGHHVHSSCDVEENAHYKLVFDSKQVGQAYRKMKNYERIIENERRSYDFNEEEINKRMLVEIFSDKDHEGGVAYTPTGMENMAKKTYDEQLREIFKRASKMLRLEANASEYRIIPDYYSADDDDGLLEYLMADLIEIMEECGEFVMAK